VVFFQFYFVLRRKIWFYYVYILARKLWLKDFGQMNLLGEFAIFSKKLKLDSVLFNAMAKAVVMVLPRDFFIFFFFFLFPKFIFS